jgi:hypothetical protein
MTFSCSKGIFINCDKYESMGKKIEITKKGQVMTSNKIIQKNRVCARKTGCALLSADRLLDVGWTSTQVSVRITRVFLFMPL